ncbi:hypothetical protein [Virgibacillus sediminis]|uniref:Uncharacterized protein n=1 Tax=Virgibacillus sediminis TaxID=202260 RepID=A0ABV7A4G6_9BACI
MMNIAFIFERGLLPETGEAYFARWKANHDTGPVGTVYVERATSQRPASDMAQS